MLRKTNLRSVTLSCSPYQRLRLYCFGLYGLIIVLTLSVGTFIVSDSPPSLQLLSPRSLTLLAAYGCLSGGLGLLILSRILSPVSSLTQQVTQLQDFVSDATHELRAPLTALSGYADLLLSWGKQDPQVLDESLAAIHEEAQYMDDVISRLLFLSRTTQGTLRDHFQQVDAAWLLQKNYDHFVALIHSHQFRLCASGPALIQAEPGSVTQLLRIFVDNAVKYTPDGGTITLSCSIQENTVVYTIADTGIGIAPEDKDLLFERSFRAAAATLPQIKGSGLGLPIARAIAAANQARISIQSVPGQGTTVSLIFPLYHP